MPRFRSVIAALLLASACGSSAGGGSGGISVHFLVHKGGSDVPCASVKEIDSVTITLTSADGRTVVPGFPKVADCAAGALSTSVAPGSYTLDVIAKGKLAGEEATLFSSHTTLTPDMRDIALSLEPEVAYLAIGWTFQDQNLMPCLSNDVKTVEVIISTGTSHTAAFDKSFPCMSTPIAIDQPFPLDMFTINIQAYSDQGAPLFSHTDMRTPTKGDQEFDFALQAVGNSLLLDWIFGIGMQTSRMCDDPRVLVTAVTATVRSTDGGAPISQVIDCAEARPVRFKEARYRPGRNLELDLVGDSMVNGQPMRFKGIDTFTMPDTDRNYNQMPLLMSAVGTATVSIHIATSTCGNHIFDGYVVTVSTADQQSPPKQVLEKMVGPTITAVAVEDLPYGAYSVAVTQVVNQMPLCSTQKMRSIDARYNTWDPFVL
jgi:hypothetical protein